MYMYGTTVEYISSSASEEAEKKVNLHVHVLYHWRASCVKTDLFRLHCICCVSNIYKILCLKLTKMNETGEFFWQKEEHCMYTL